jgi:hypothetical protein
VVAMLKIDRIEDSSKECFQSKISYKGEGDIICIEHFSRIGSLLSEAHMTYEEALTYARLITEVCDKALGIE